MVMLLLGEIGEKRGIKDLNNDKPDCKKSQTNNEEQKYNTKSGRVSAGVQSYLFTLTASHA